MLRNSQNSGNFAHVRKQWIPGSLFLPHILFRIESLGTRLELVQYTNFRFTLNIAYCRYGKGASNGVNFSAEVKMLYHTSNTVQSEVKIGVVAKMLSTTHGHGALYGHSKNSERTNHSFS